MRYPQHYLGEAQIGLSLFALRGIRFVEGEGGAKPAEGEPATDPADDPTDPEPGAQEGDGGDKPGGDEGKTEDLPDWARQKLTKANNEAANLRKRLKTDVDAASKKAAADARTELAQTLGKSLGFVNEEPTVDDLTKALGEKDSELDAERQTTVALRVENVVLRFAPKAGADADALLDSRTFVQKLAEIDPADDDFASQAEALVTDWVKENPRYRNAQVATSANTDGKQPAGEQKPSGHRSIDDIRKERQKRRAG